MFKMPVFLIQGFDYRTLFLPFSLGPPITFTFRLLDTEKLAADQKDFLAKERAGVV